jgi:glycosyltransferase involved in cell wall biosynthesis
LQTCLEAIAGLEYPAEQYEVIVVDDGGQAQTASIIEAYQSRLSIKLIAQERSGPAYARNAGVSAATGRYVAFVDDDCAPQPGWLARMAAQFEMTPDDLLGGHTVNRLAHNPYSTASQELIDYLYGWFNSGLNGPVFITSNNMAMPVRQFHEIGGFDTAFLRAAGEDRDFCDQWKHSGLRITYVPDALVYHSHDMNFLGFWWQHFNYGRGAYRFHQARARRGHERVRLEPLQFYLKLLMYPLTQRRSWLTNLHISLLLGISQGANMAGYFWERWIVKP